MCTVTYIPSAETIFLTSNRDENSWRSSAFPPAVAGMSSGKVIFPKDGDHSGTWIAGHENGNAVVFLNGAFQSHTPEPPYRKSRGLILLDLVDHPTPYNGFLAINLNRIEPFTAVIRDNDRLFECRWDGRRKSNAEIDPETMHIWSSVTLYDEMAAQARADWFGKWQSEHKTITQQEILNFHRFAGSGDQTNDLLMNRNNQVFTVSISSLAINAVSLKFLYLDVQNNQQYQKELARQKSLTTR